MEDNTPDDFVTVKFSIGSTHYSDADGLFNNPAGLVFDHHRGLLFVADSFNHRVQVFAADDGSFVAKFGARCLQANQLRSPWGIAIEHEQERIVVVDCSSHRLQRWSLKDDSFLSFIDSYSPQLQEGVRELDHPHGVAIDKHNQRVLVANTHFHHLMSLASSNLSSFNSIGKYGFQPREFFFPTGVAIDDDRHRIIVTESDGNRVQVLSSIDGSFLFQFGSKGNQPGQFDYPLGVCIANQGRIIVADSSNYRLQAFTHEGHHISSFDCGEHPVGVAFDEYRGLIAFSAGHRVHVIGANQWLADTFVWRPDRHRYAPSWIKQTVLTITMIRSLVDESSAMSMIPNELLFEIFSMLAQDPPRAVLPSRVPQMSARSRSSQCATM